MFEVTLQTYWADLDPAGIVFFPHFFRFVEQAEAEMYRSRGVSPIKLLEQHGVWLPRVEAFAKYLAPIRSEARIRVRLTPTLKGQKTIRYDFEILDAETAAKLAHGYVTVVCVDRKDFKSTPLPAAIREALKSVEK
jgi:YbgC/YbaW family acyl-CoA thioester hydrolase